jgi:hypothetical protein
MTSAIGVEAVQLEQIDVIGLQALERRVHGLNQMEARRADAVRAIVETEGRLGRDDRFVALALERFAEHRFGRAARIDVRAVEHGDARIEADVEQTPRLGDVGRAPRLEKLALAAECARAETQHRHLETGCTQMSVFH